VISLNRQQKRFALILLLVVCAVFEMRTLTQNNNTTNSDDDAEFRLASSTTFAERHTSVLSDPRFAELTTAVAHGDTLLSVRLVRQLCRSAARGGAGRAPPVAKSSSTKRNKSKKTKRPAAPVAVDAESDADDDGEEEDDDDDVDDAVVVDTNKKQPSQRKGTVTIGDFSVAYRTAAQWEKLFSPSADAHNQEGLSSVEKQCWEWKREYGVGA
jgi:hypothetical protein